MVLAKDVDKDSELFKQMVAGNTSQSESADEEYRTSPSTVTTSEDTYPDEDEDE